MAKISKDDLEHVANLARLELSESEKAEFSEQFGSVLEYFKKLDAANTSEVQPIDQINEMDNIVTIDEVGKQSRQKDLLANAPETENGLIKVKAVFE